MVLRFLWGKVLSTLTPVRVVSLIGLDSISINIIQPALGQRIPSRERSSGLVVVSALQKLDSISLDLIDQAMLLSDPSGPDIACELPKPLRLAYSIKRVFQSCLHQAEKFCSNSSIGLHPMSKVLQKLNLENRFVLQLRRQRRRAFPKN